MSIKKVHIKCEQPFWGSFLKTVNNYSDGIKSNKYIKNGGYYPRMKQTSKRGLRAYEEVILDIKSDDEELQTIKQYLNDIIRCKQTPEIHIDTLIICESDFIKLQSSEGSTINKLYYDEKLIVSDEKDLTIVKNQVIDNTEIDTTIKLTAVLNLIDGLDFTTHELVGLDLQISQRVLDALKK